MVVGWADPTPESLTRRECGVVGRGLGLGHICLEKGKLGTIQPDTIKNAKFSKIMLRHVGPVLQLSARFVTIQSGLGMGPT